MTFYKAAQAVMRPIGRLFFLLSGENGGGLPNGPAVLVCNHRSNLDPVLLGIVVDRPLHFMAKDELFHLPLLTPLIRALGAFPVKRGRADVSAMQTALRLLDGGEVVAMFPEGTRQRGPAAPLRFKSGAVRLAFEKKCPVVPAAILRGRGFWIFRRRVVRVGRAIPFGRLGTAGGTADDMRRVSAMLRQRVAELLGLPAGS